MEVRMFTRRAVRALLPAKRADANRSALGEKVADRPDEGAADVLRCSFTPGPSPRTTLIPIERRSVGRGELFVRPTTNRRLHPLIAARQRARCTAVSSSSN